MEPLTLVIDTACSWITIGLFGPSVNEARSIHAPREAFNSLVPEIQTILNGRKPTGIVCVTGPGSFTGIRIGVSCSRMLAQLWKIPVAGISSLAAAAFAVCDKESHAFAVCIDGKQKRFYTLVVETVPVASDERARYLSTLPVRDLTAGEVGLLNLPVYCEGEVPGYAGTLRLSSGPDAARHFAFFQESGLNMGSYEDLMPYYHRQDPAEQKFPGGIQRP
jgi:tRNA threonylcarbamoyladenosine biosynthesis protein TsaB